ncbi:MAG TPA: cytidine deaminase [Candidatus Eisenbacteria bacterium]|nr:cytidine deaminase [Candidatus Eisenbacteria bacterium]
MPDSPSATLIGAARALLPRAAARYSGFRVAAVLEDESGEIHPGVNVESVSYGLSMCAERNALFGAVARGARGFRRIAIVSSGSGPVVPCGACRQLLLEYAPDLVVILSGSDGPPEEVSIGDLLPRAFLSFDRTNP